MKKFFITLLFSCSLFLTSYGSHNLGGEIGWTCLSNGKYIFHMNYLRDCTGIPTQYWNEIIDVSGYPLPGLSTITLHPDSSRWANSGNGMSNSICSSQYGTPFSCANQDVGMVQQFFYVSDTIQLTGVPPSTGWKFTWESSFGRPFPVVNAGLNSNLTLEATMFANSNNDSVDTCYDSAPKFTNLPNMFVCRGKELNYNHFVMDVDGDSLSYEWGIPHVSGTPWRPVQYNTGYSYSNPTPDTNINSNNIASTLNPRNGSVNFAIASGNSGDRYIKKIKVSSWRDGVKISEVNREFAYIMVDCPTLPSGVENEAPEFSMSISRDNDGVYRDTVVAGTRANYTLTLSDTVVTGWGSGYQNFTLVAFGNSFSLDFSDSTNCLDSNDSTCAVLGASPFLNTNVYPNVYQLSGIYRLSTTFNWSTNCDDLATNGGAKTHYFYFKYFDQHCPVPGSNYRELEITVVPSSQPCNLVTGSEKVNRNSLENTFNYFPNPTNGKLFINSNKTHRNLNLIVRNIRGQVVQQNKYFNQNTIELEIEGKAGIYFIEVLNEQGEKANLKLIKN